MTVTVNRAFEKRATEKSNWSGRVGMAELVADVGPLGFVLNGKTIPAAMVDYLLTFSLQSLQDAYAGADSLDEATANFEKKLDAVQNGTIGARTSSGVGEETICQRLVAKAAFLASAKVSDAEKTRVREMSDEESNSFFDGLFEKNAAKLADAVSRKKNERAEARAKRAAEKAEAAKMADTLDI